MRIGIIQIYNFQELCFSSSMRLFPYSGWCCCGRLAWPAMMSAALSK